MLPAMSCCLTHIPLCPQVQILVGKDKGRHGYINSVIKERNWVYVDGLNCVSSISRFPLWNSPALIRRDSPTQSMGFPGCDSWRVPVICDPRGIANPDSFLASLQLHWMECVEEFFQINVLVFLDTFKTQIKAISSNTHQLHTMPLHQFTIWHCS